MRADVVKIAARDGDTEIHGLLCPPVMNTTDDHTDSNKILKREVGTSKNMHMEELFSSK